MKYCSKCGAENPSLGIFCSECGEKLIQEPVSGTQSTPTFNRGESASTIQPVREKYGQIIFHSSYNTLLIGALLFGLSPLIGIGVILISSLINPVENELISILGSLINPICFAIFIYGIYSVSKIEPFTLNDQLRSVSLFLALHVVAGFVTEFFLEDFGVGSMETLEQARDVALQGTIIVLIQLGISILLVLGAIKFTTWFEEFVTVLGAPYNAPTGRFKWFAFFTVGYWGLLAVSYLMLLRSFDSLSYSTVNNAFTILGIATILALVAFILQILSGYKIYSVLNNIRKGKYDGTYQAQIQNRYRS